MPVRYKRKVDFWADYKIMLIATEDDENILVALISS